MKNRRYHIVLMLLTLIGLECRGQVESNVVMPEVRHVYTLQTEGDGEKMRVTKIKHTEEMSYTALRVPCKALAFTFYDKITTIDKAKSKGVIPEYSYAKDNGIFYDDSRICMMMLQLEPGKETNVQFETTITRPGYRSMLFLEELYPVRNLEISYRMPVALKGKIDIAQRNMPSTATVSREVSANGKEYVITVSAKDLPAMKSEYSAPSARHLFPYVQLIGLFKDVDELYGNLRTYTSDEDPGRAEVERFARELTQNCSTPIEKMHAIQDWVRENIRYVAIEAGDLGFKPDAPSAVLTKRFGDCKGSAALIKSMLKGVGLDGRLVWIGTSSIPEDFTEVPNPSTGNHMIAAAVINDSIYYIDGTCGLAPHGYYTSGIQGKQTIVENGDRPIVGRVPVMSPEVSTDNLKLTGKIVDGSFTGELSNRVSGYYKYVLKENYRQADEDKKNRVLKGYLDEGRKNCSYSDLTLSGMETTDPTGEIVGKITMAKAATESGSKIYFNPSLFPTMKDMKCDMKNRTKDYSIGGLRKIEREVTVAVPDGTATGALPEKFALSNDYMDSAVDYTEEDGCVRCRFSLTIKKSVVPFGELSGYNDGVTKINKALSRRITFQRQ